MPLSFTPDHYNVLTEMIGCEMHNDITQQHRLYIKRLEKHSKCRSEETVFYWTRRFIDLLDIEKTVNKCFESEPFRSMGEVREQRGTVVYRHFMQLSRSILFYDVEKIIWRYGHPHMRRLLNTIKIFDSEPCQINFTEKLYLIILRLYEMVNNTTPLLWN
jgi:hypothetical protein